MSERDDPSDELWELVELCSREALLLRSFLEYLRSWPDPPEKKSLRLQNWHKEIGLQLGNPAVAEHASNLFRKLRDAAPEERKEILQKSLETMYSSYFGS